MPVSATSSRRVTVIGWLLAVGVAFQCPAAWAAVYQDPAAFVRDAFGGHAPAPRMLWITKALRPAVRAVLGHDLGALRVRYWGRGHTTAWILEEVGKERPITVGVVIRGTRITRLEVLIFRESRGWEVRHPFFTRQFHGAGLAADGGLDRNVDGISGATLSVHAVTRIARLALLLHQHTEFADGAPPHPPE